MSTLKRYLWDKSFWNGQKRYSNFIINRFQWQHLLFWNKKEFEDIKAYLKERTALGYKIYPQSKPNGKMSWKKIFRCLVETSFKDTKIVILGQDPYYTQGMADGLAFSVPPNIQKIPGSLGNIFIEYQKDLGFPYPRTGDLSTWARNGILLLNTIWTVEDGTPRAHAKINGKQLWQNLTTEILQILSRRKDKLVFILWGNEAQEWRYLIDEKKHLVLVGAHPSPRNFTWNGNEGTAKFFGGRYFSKACDYLELDRKIWRLP